MLRLWINNNKSCIEISEKDYKRLVNLEINNNKSCIEMMVAVMNYAVAF